MKKLFSIILASALMALMAVSVFAADTENYSCDFSEANADYKCYQPSEGNGFIADGKLTIAAWWPTMVNLDNHTFGDGTYEFDMNVGADKDWAGVMFCKTNPADIWDHSGYLFLVTPSGDFQFHQCTGGPQQLANGTIEGFVNEENHYKIVKDGESIKIYFGDSETPIVDVTDATYTEGYFSFVSTSAGTNAHTTLDNLSIKLPGSDEPAETPDEPAETPDEPTETPDEPTDAPQTGFATVALSIVAALSAGYVVSKKH